MGLMKLRDLNVFDVNGQHPNYTDHWGHPGADWGSQLGIPPGQLVGYWPALNTSMALASSTLVNMNASAPSHNLTNIFSCRLMGIVAQHVRPDLHRLNCTYRYST
jgi:hypothetical protein